MVFFLIVTMTCYAQELDLIVSSEEITAKISEVAAQINEDYKGKELTIVSVMKGAICVTADLIRHLTIPFKLECVKYSSYGQNGIAGGKMRIEGEDHLDLKGRDVLLVDDIFERGNTILSLIDVLQERQPNSIKSLVLLLKEVPRKTTYLPDYALFTIANRFVVGYGMDYKELYRGLPEVYAFPGDQPPD